MGVTQASFEPQRLRYNY